VKRVFLDTDVGNEIDDQFAIAYAVRHPELRVEAIGGAFFTGEGFVALPDSADIAHELAMSALEDLGRTDIPVYRGLRGPLREHTTHEDSARAIIELAHAGPDPLYVISIGAASNIAYALSLDPSIAPHIRAVFIDGDYPWGPALYNVPNDIEAFQTLLDSDADYLHLPAPNVTGALAIDLDHVRGLFPVGDRVGRSLIELSETSYARAGVDQWTIWDVAAIAAVARPELTETVTDGAPLFEHDPDAQLRQRITPRPDNPRRIGVVTAIDVDAIWDDFRTVMANALSRAS
jgi:inosine-uridine nucleoside N-ribohydrolase